MLDNTESVIRKVYLDDLVLDPNNFRFVDHEYYKEILDEEKFDDPNLQFRILNILLGEKNKNVKDLFNSYLSNGILEHDYIQVVPLKNKEGKFLVIEGNRRTACLKYIKKEFEKGLDLNKLDKKYLFEEELPVACHNSIPLQTSLIMTGLQHVTKKQSWSAYNQALFVGKLLDIEPYKSNREKVIEELAISNRLLNQIERTLSLIKQFQDLKYKFHSEKYNYFVEIIRSPDLRKWIEWDEYSYKAKNINNLNRLFSYFIEGGKDILDSNGEEQDDEDENHAYLSGRVLITDSKDLRALGRIINDPKKLKEFEKTGVIPSAEGVNPDHIQFLNETILKIESQREALNLEELYQISNFAEKLNLIAKSKQFFLPILYKENDKKELYLNGHNTKQFSEIRIKHYKKFKEFSLNNLNRINIFAGKNNAGKTTLLEAFLLLANQTNYRSLFEITMKRAKHVESTADTFSLLIQSIPELIEIEGKINSLNTSISYKSSKEEEDGEVKANRVKVFSELDQDKQSIEILIQDFGSIKELANIGKNKKLLRSVYSSPFSVSHSELVEACHTMSLNVFERNGQRFIAKDKIMEFVRKYVDPKIRYIEMDRKNFKVTHEELQTMFLWEYGEGLQRVFYIALLFAYAENGIVCIDEFENAVYFGLLKEFTKLVQELAVEFNVQVFLTTHSKECVDAFVLNEYRTEDISAYTLITKKDGTADSFHYAGDDLKGYIEDMDTDVRVLF